MEELERVVIEDTGDSGYFKDVVARLDLEEVKKNIEEISNTHEITSNEVNETYSKIYKEIFG